MDSYNEKSHTMSSESRKKQELTAQSESTVYESICLHLTDARTKSFNAINVAMVQAYWEIGRDLAKVSPS